MRKEPPGTLSALVGDYAELAQRCERLQAEHNQLMSRCSELNKEIQAVSQRCLQLAAQAEQSRSGGVNGGDVLGKMRADWDERARLNALYYTNTAKFDWDDKE